jgi:predicted PurR-regulated permease PerM
MNTTQTRPARTPGTGEWGSRRQVHTMVLILATAIGVYLCFRLAQPFLAALAWALALAVLFDPIHRRIEEKLRRPNAAATISVLLVAMVVLLIAAFVGARLLSEVVKGAAMLKTKVESGEWGRALESNPYIAPIGQWIETNTDLTRAVSAAASWLATKSGSIVQGSVIQIAGFLLTFYFLFYFLRDRAKILGALPSLFPVPAPALDRICDRVVDTIDATLYGTIAIAAIQGTLGGLIFWILGLPAPVLWGVVMGLLAVVPLMGAFIVWIPAAVMLLVDGSWGKAIVLTVWGSVVIGGIDNLLYPMLVGNRLRLHTIVAFISTIGGLIVFGVSGVILGPLAVTITFSLLELWRTRPAEPKSAAPRTLDR